MSEQYTLVVNIGNSNIRFGVFDKLEVKESWTINTKPYRSSDEYSGMIEGIFFQHRLRPAHISKVILGSVVPKLTAEMIEGLGLILDAEVKVVDRDTPSGVRHKSGQMGTDLYANAVAAHHFYDGFKIIIDFGTALTFTGVADDGEIIGVSIAPGVRTSLDSLVQKTAQLPDIEFKTPNKVLASDTISCMQSGMVYGYLSMIEGMIERIGQMHSYEKSNVIATGGLSHIYAPLASKIHFEDKFHTIKGLMILGESDLGIEN